MRRRRGSVRERSSTVPVGLQHAAQTPGRHPHLVDGVGRVAADPQLLGGDPVDLAADVVHEHRPGRALPARAPPGAGRSMRSSSAAAAGAPGRMPVSPTRAATPSSRSSSAVARPQVDLGPRPDVGAAAHRRHGDVVVDERGEQPVVPAEQPVLRAHRADVARPGAARPPVRRRGRARRTRRGRPTPSPAGMRRVSSGRSSRQWAGADGRPVQPERDARRGEPGVVGVVAVGLEHLGERGVQPEDAGQSREVRQPGAAPSRNVRRRGVGHAGRVPRARRRRSHLILGQPAPSRPCPCRCGAAHR